MLLDATAAGGQAAASSRIEDYRGFPRGVGGEELTRLALVQAMKLSTALHAMHGGRHRRQRRRRRRRLRPLTASRAAPMTQTESVTPGDHGSVTVHLADKSQDTSAGGHRRHRCSVPAAQHRPLGRVRTLRRYSRTRPPNLTRRRCESRPVTVVGGANFAGQAALFLTSRAPRVDLVVRSPDLSPRCRTTWLSASGSTRWFAVVPRRGLRPGGRLLVDRVADPHGRRVKRNGGERRLVLLHRGRARHALAHLCCS